MKQSIFFGSVFILMVVQFSCNSDAQQSRSNEVEFTVDSSYFDYSAVDTFHHTYIPRLEDWQLIPISSSGLEHDSYLLNKPEGSVAVIFSTHPSRSPSSYNFYKGLADDENFGNDILDLSNFVKNGIKLTQLIMKNENQTIFKVIYDNDNSSEEVDIYIDNKHYTEENIRLTESIIGQLNFIKH